MRSGIYAICLSALVASGIAVPGPVVAASLEAGLAAPRRPTVAVIRATDGGATGQEIATRIIDELLASNVTILTIGCAVIDAACLGPPRANVGATVLVFQRERLPVVEVRVPGSEGRERRIDVDPASTASPTALAVRTVEVLHSVSLEPDASHTGAAPLEPTSSRPTGQRDDDERDVPEAPPLPAISSSAAALRVGGAMFRSTGGLAPSYGAAATLLRPLTRSVEASLFLAGSAFGGQDQAAAGDVTIKQALAQVQIALRGTVTPRLAARAGLGAGVHYLHMEGTVNGEPALAANRFSPAFGGSASLAFVLNDHLALFLEGQVYFLTRVPVVLVNGVEVGRTGSPGVALVAGGEFRL